MKKELLLATLICIFLGSCHSEKYPKSTVQIEVTFFGGGKAVKQFNIQLENINTLEISNEWTGGNMINHQHR